MKIFPSDHKIKSVTNSHVDLDLNIPLAYIELDYTKYKIDKVMEPTASIDIKEEVLLNQEFNTPDIKLFNKFNEEVDMDNLLTRVNDKYYYRPKEMISFAPHRFNYKATIKSNVSYKIANRYNINIACVDDPDSLDLSKRIAVGFSNPSNRNIVPPNISINNNRIDAHAFTDMSIQDCDILFIESPNGINYDDSPKPIEIDKNVFLNNNTSIWIASDFDKNYPYENTPASQEYKLKNPYLNNKVSYFSDVYFNTDGLPANSNIIYHNLFDTKYPPILIVEHIGKGYEIISHSKIFDDIQSNIQIMYEMIMYCYMNSYKSTGLLNQWITTEVPDYQIESGKLVRKKYFVSDVNLYKYFNLKGDEMILYDVTIENDTSPNTPDNPNSDLYEYATSINFIGMNGGRLMFDKAKDSVYNNEPEKPTNWISIYDGANVVYLKEIHYIIETNLEDKVFTKINDDDLTIKVLAFKSTSLGINTQMPFDLIVPFIKTSINGIEKIREAEYLFYINKENQNISFVFVEDFKDDLGIPLFKIVISQTPDSVKTTDMRQLGGGLVEWEEDNYNLLDIGHLKGRPYRKAGTLIFTFPKKYEKHKKIIETAIKKYIGASEMPVIFFEDK